MNTREPISGQTLLRPAWKRIEDLCVGSIATVLISPLLLVVAAATFIDDGWPIVYASDRVGIGGTVFRMLKFRTMVRGAEVQGLGLQTSADDPRITRTGRVVRRWSLDELPQLFNVLSGKMSIVGPRPTVASQVERYTPEHAVRLLVKPGITGLAQVSGRNDLEWRERIALDVKYVREMNPRLDARILLRTVKVVLQGKGLYGREGVTPDY